MTEEEKFIQAVKDGDLEAVTKAFKEKTHEEAKKLANTVDNSLDKIGRKDQNIPVLNWAANKEHSEITDLLIEKGADVTAKNADGNTALHMSALSNNASISQALLKAGADPKAQNDSKEKETALDIAKRHNNAELNALLTPSKEPEKGKGEEKEEGIGGWLKGMFKNIGTTGGIAGIALGGIGGFLMGGPMGAIIGAVLGAIVGPMASDAITGGDDESKTGGGNKTIEVTQGLGKALDGMGAAKGNDADKRFNASEFDANKDGKIEISEIKTKLVGLGVTLDGTEINQLRDHMAELSKDISKRDDGDLKVVKDKDIMIDLTFNDKQADPSAPNYTPPTNPGENVKGVFER